MNFLAIIAILLIFAVTLSAKPVENAKGSEAFGRAGHPLFEQVTDGINWVLNKLG